MKTVAKFGLAALLVAVFAPADVWAQAAKVVIPAGSVLHVRLRTTLTSKTSKTGDKFDGIVEKAVRANGREVVPVGSVVDGHVAYIKPSGRFRGRAQMRILLDTITTPDQVQYSLAGTLEDAAGSPCAKTGSDDEGTIKGCGKSKKDALKDAGIGGAMGAGAGATIGLGSEIDCRYFGNCGGPGMGSATLYGAGIGAVTAVVYHLFKHEKQVVLVGGTHLTFIVNRSVDASEAAAEGAAAEAESENPPAQKN